MVKQLDYISAHFHRVDAWTWLRVGQLERMRQHRLAHSCNEKKPKSN